MVSILPVIIGSAVGGILTLAGVIIQHCFEIRKLTLQLKEYPSHIIYDKQMQFFNQVVPLFDELNGYITTIDVWLGEKGEKARIKVQEAIKNSDCVGKFSKILDDYYIYLPSGLLREARNLLSLCWELMRKPTTDITYDSIHVLFSFENSIRKLMGIDALSADLLKAFGADKKERQRLLKEE